MTVAVVEPSSFFDGGAGVGAGVGVGGGVEEGVGAPPSLLLFSGCCSAETITTRRGAGLLLCFVEMRGRGAEVRAGGETRKREREEVVPRPTFFFFFSFDCSQLPNSCLTERC